MNEVELEPTEVFREDTGFSRFQVKSIPEAYKHWSNSSSLGYKRNHQAPTVNYDALQVPTSCWDMHSDSVEWNKDRLNSYEDKGKIAWGMYTHHLDDYLTNFGGLNSR